MANGKRVDIEQKKVYMEEALALRLSGMSYREISSSMGISTASAFNYVKEALNSIIANTKETAEQLREAELERFDIMLKALWPKVESGDEAAVDRALKISAERRKLLGIDAPAKQDINTNMDGNVNITTTHNEAGKLDTVNKLWNDILEDKDE